MQSLSQYVEREAERLVAKAIVNQATELSFDSLRIEKLPASITQLTQLNKLSLNNCRQLTDVALIEALTNLETLELANCEVLTALLPMASLQKLRQFGHKSLSSTD